MALKQHWIAFSLVLLLMPGGLTLADAGGSEPATVERRVPLLSLDGDIAGNLKAHRTRYEDTFAELGNRLSLGYLELVKANPGVDPWLPGEGTSITLPQQYVLPETERDGIVVNLAEYRLYYFHDGGVEVYPVGVGTEENPSPLTNATVTMSLKAPAWYPPKSIRAEYAASGDYLPPMIPPGPDNPLGPFALLLSESGYLIHGTNKRFGVGMQVSHGCFRMYNEDISYLAGQVANGTSVQVIHQPVKIGVSGNEIWLEVHRPKENYSDADRDRLWQAVSTRLARLRDDMPNVELQRQAVELAVDQGDGLPRLIGERLTRVAAEEHRHDGDADRGPSQDTQPTSPQLWF